MKAGGLRTLLTILAAPTARNQFNEVVSANDPTQWATVAQVWGQVSPLRGVLLDIAQASVTTAAASIQVVCRYNPSIAVTNRIAITTPSGTKYLTIEAVLDENNRHRMLTLLCSQKVG